MFSWFFCLQASFGSWSVFNESKPTTAAGSTDTPIFVTPRQGWMRLDHASVEAQVEPYGLSLLRRSSFGYEGRAPRLRRVPTSHSPTGFHPWLSAKDGKNFLENESLNSRLLFEDNEAITPVFLPA